MAELDEVGATLLAAASQLLATEGPGALTVRRIAAEAGMSTMNVYSRFGNKHGVVECLFVDGFELLAAAMDSVPKTDDPMADLRACGDAYRRFAFENPTLYSVMFERPVADFQPSPEAGAVAMGTLQLLAERLERAMDAGVMRRQDSTFAAAVVWSTCHGAVSLELKQTGPESVDWALVHRDATDTLFTGMRS